MKYLNFTKYLAFVAVVALVFTACKKTKLSTPMGDAGQTLVKILNGGTPASVNKFAIDFVPTPTTLLVVELRRDIPSETELNKTMVVTVKDDTAAVTATGLGYLHLPTAWYTVSYGQSGVVKTGGQAGIFTATFGPGEFSKEIYVTIPDATLLNPSSLYGLGFTILTADAGGKISTQKSIVIQIGAKNSYDGVYENTFTNYHPSANPGYTGDVVTIHMITTGADRCKMWWPDAGAFGIPSILNGALGYFGAQEPAYIVNPATNGVTVANTVGSIVYTMAAGYTSYYDGPSKTFYVKFGYNNPGGVFDPAVTREWTQQLKYTGPR